MRKNKIDIISLGCSKNLVDSEHLMRQFAANGYTLEHNPTKVNGEIVVVNTCGFIQDAQQESIEMILQLVDLKREGKIRKLFVMGCLAERFLADLQNEPELAEVDHFYGKFSWKQILADLGKAYNDDIANERVLTTPKLHKNIGGLQPLLRVLRHPAHHRPPQVGAYARRHQRSAEFGEPRRERV